MQTSKGSRRNDFFNKDGIKTLSSTNQLAMNREQSIAPFKKFIESIAHFNLPEAWEEMALLFKQRTLEKGELFAEQGEISNKIAFIVKGTARTFLVNQDGKEFSKYFNVSGQLMAPYASIIRNEPSFVSIEALTQCEILEANYSEVSELGEKYKDVQKILRGVPEMLFVLNEIRSIQLVMLSAKERYEVFRKDFPGLENEINQYHIASFLGITPIQLSRIRKQ